MTVRLANSESRDIFADICFLVGDNGLDGERSVKQSLMNDKKLFTLKAPYGDLNTSFLLFLGYVAVVPWDPKVETKQQHI
jgi:hypothetical protein